MEASRYGFKKSFAGTSVNGITFHWLRYTYGKAFDLAISKAVWMIYVSSTYAALPETWSKVTTSVVQSREIFYQMMELAKGAPKPKKPLPKRVEVSFKGKFESALEEVLVFEWLSRRYGDKVADFVVHAVWLVYSPAALSTFPERNGDALVQVERSRFVFEHMMTWAIAQANGDKTALIANRLDKTLLSSFITEPESRFNPSPPVEATSPKEVETSAPADPPESPSTEATGEFSAVDGEDFDDDYVPPNYDLDFDN